MVFILKRGVSGSKLPSCPSPASTASTATPEWTAASSALCHPFFNSASNGRTGEPSDSGGASPDVTRPVPTVGTTGRPHRWGSHGVLGLPITIYYTHIHTHTRHIHTQDLLHESLSFAQKTTSRTRNRPDPAKLGRLQVWRNQVT